MVWVGDHLPLSFNVAATATGYITATSTVHYDTQCVAVRADGHQEAKMRASDSGEPIAEHENRFIRLRHTAL